MRRCLWLLVAFAAALPALADVETTRIVGKVLTPSGLPAKRGQIVCELSQAGTVDDGGTAVRVASRTLVTLGSDGSVDCKLVPNDVILPAGTFYVCTHNVEADRRVSWVERWTIDATPDPIDIGDITRLDVVPGITTGAFVEYVESAPSGSCNPHESPKYVTSTGEHCACVSGSWSCTSGGGGGGGAPTSAQYVVAVADGTLTAERVLAAGTNTAIDTATAGQIKVNVADATTSAKGVVQLAGDLGGTASAPTIAANAVALGTDTTGNYAASDAEAGAALDISCASCVALGGETAGAYVASATANQGLLVTGTFDAVSIGLQACASGEILKNSGGTSWACAADATGGGGANSFETVNAPAGTDPIADSATDTLNITASAPVTVTGDSSTDTLTFAVSGATTGAQGVVQLAGDLGGTAAAPTIAANAVALTTDTTGNYVASISTSAPLSGGAAGSEGAAIALSIANATSGAVGVLQLAGDLGGTAAAPTIAANAVALGTDTTGDYVSGATASQGLAKSGTEGATLGLQDCAAGEVLKRNAGDTGWECAADGGGAASGGAANSVNVANGSGGWTALNSTLAESGGSTTFDAKLNTLGFLSSSAITLNAGSYVAFTGPSGLQVSSAGGSPPWQIGESATVSYSTGSGEFSEMLSGAERKQLRFDPFDYEAFPGAGGNADQYGGGFDFFCDADGAAFEIASCEFSGVFPTSNATHTARDVRLGSAIRPWTQAWITSWLANLDGDGDYEAVFQSSATGADDQVLVGAGQGQFAGKTLPDCDNATTSKLLYDQATNAFSCGTDQAGGSSSQVLWSATLLDPSNTVDLHNCDGTNSTCLLGPRMPAARTLSSIHCYIDPASSGKTASLTLFECSFSAWTCTALHSGTITPGHTPTSVTLTDTSLASGSVLAIDINSADTTIDQLVCTWVGS